MQPLPSAAAALDPENRIRFFLLEKKTELHLQLLRAASAGEKFFRLRRHFLDFRDNPPQCLLQRDEFIAVLFEKLAAVLECEPAVALREQGKEKRRALAQALDSAG